MLDKMACLTGVSSIQQKYSLLSIILNQNTGNINLEVCAFLEVKIVASYLHLNTTHRQPHI